MRKHLTIAVLADRFIGWGGGTDFLKHCVKGLASKSDEYDFKMVVCIPSQTGFLYSSKSVLKALKATLVQGRRRSNGNLADQTGSKRDPSSHFLGINDRISVEFYNSDPFGRNLLSKLRSLRADVVIPTMRPLGSRYPIPWVGYVYDFQHKYFTELFSDRERRDRDQYFCKMLNESFAVITNSASVSEDINKFYPEKRSHIFSLPFAPVAPDSWLFEDRDVRDVYKLPDKYFVISNQFWVHKSHITAFEALSLLCKRGLTNIHIVCTGALEDYRQPTYIPHLKQQIDKLGLVNKIHLLGHIPKRDQIEIVKNSIALLQPTLFEGGPGGGSVYDAVALGVPSIVSDIPVNLEVSGANVFFFRANSSEDMAAKMATVLSSIALQRPSRNELAEYGQRGLQTLGNVMLDSIDYAIAKHGL